MRIIFERVCTFFFLQILCHNKKFYIDVLSDCIYILYIMIIYSNRQHNPIYSVLLSVYTLIITICLFLGHLICLLTIYRQTTRHMKNLTSADQTNIMKKRNVQISLQHLSHVSFYFWVIMSCKLKKLSQQLAGFDIILILCSILCFL